MQINGMKILKTALYEGQMLLTTTIQLHRSTIQPRIHKNIQESLQSELIKMPAEFNDLW